MAEKLDEESVALRPSAAEALSRRGSLASSSQLSESDIDNRTKSAKRLRSPDEKKKKHLKKTRTASESDDEGEDFIEDDPLADLDNILEKMKAWWTQPTIVKMVTKPQTEKFGRLMHKMQNGIVRAREMRADQEGRSNERGDILKLLRAVSNSIESTCKMVTDPEATYSAALKKDVPKVPRVTGTKGPVVQAPNRVIVRHETKESEEVTKILKSSVNPSEIGLKVRRLLKIRNGVIVEAESEEGASNLVGQEALKRAGLTVERQEKKKPCIMIYDVGATLTDDDIMGEIYKRNMGNSNIEEMQFKEEFLIRHRYSDRRSGGAKCHIVAECSVRVRNWLRHKERVFVEWQSCRVKDYIDVARCFKCQRFGHVAKHCRSEKTSCSYCAGEHDFKECKQKGEKEKVCCVNCTREKRDDCRHEAGWRKCPVYEKAVKRENEKTDYGVTAT